MRVALYDASFGGSAGLNVSVVTKVAVTRTMGPCRAFPGTMLDANDFFRKHTDQGCPCLENQFGSHQGPIRGDGSASLPPVRAHARRTVFCLRWKDASLVPVTLASLPEQSPSLQLLDGRSVDEGARWEAFSGYVQRIAYQPVALFS